MSGNVELNLGHNLCRNCCGICSKFVKKADKALRCNDCYKMIHYSCMQMNKTSEDSWYCPNWGFMVLPKLCSTMWNLLRKHPAIMCDSCSTWMIYTVTQGLLALSIEIYKTQSALGKVQSVKTKMYLYASRYSLLRMKIALKCCHQITTLINPKLI